jgi:hypothetical protein
LLWRMQKIMNNNFKRVVITETYVLRIVCIALFVTNTLVVIEVCLGRPYVNEISVTSGQYRTVCSFHRIQYFWGLIFIVIIIALYGAYLSYKTRNLIESFNESGIFAIGIISFSLMCILKGLLFFKCLL